MLKSEAIEKYGEEMLKKMQATGYLTGITVSMKDGEVDIPEHDLDLAYRAAKGEKIHPFEVD